MSIEEYNRISTNNVAQFTLNPKQYKPEPTEREYAAGWIYRYFMRKINDEFATIYEISQKQYEVFNTFSMYNVVRIKWNISLPHTLEDDIGAIEFNRKQIRNGMLIISNLNIYFNNLLEYHIDGGRASVGFILPAGQVLGNDGIIRTESENKIIGRINK